jgi:type I restriction enzyme S subunit
VKSFSEVRIGDIAKAQGGKRLPKGASLQDEPTQHAYLRVTDFGESGIDRSAIKFIDESTHHQIRRYTISSTDVYVSIAGTIGRVGMVPEDLAGANLTENAAKVTNISDAVDGRYLMYFLRGSTGQAAMANQASGTSQPKLALYRIEDIRFPCLSLREQRKIVSLLSAYDDLIENNRRRIVLLEEAARMLYREWFVRFRFPGHEHIKLIDGIPDGWERRTLGEIAETNRESYGAKELPDKIKYIDISSVSRGQIESKSSMLASDAPGRARRKATDGDVIWSNVRPNLRAYALILEPEEADVFSTGFTVLTATEVPFTWLYQFVTTDHFVSHLVNHATGAGYPAVRPDDFARATVVVPPRALLTLFHEATEPNLRMVARLNLQNMKLAQARDLLLPRLMNGEIAV